jgi:hypothetical protein
VQPAKLSQAEGAHPGQAQGDLAARVANEGPGIPPHEHGNSAFHAFPKAGGNRGIKKGGVKHTYMPIYVEGANSPSEIPTSLKATARSVLLFL